MTDHQIQKIEVGSDLYEAEKDLRERVLRIPLGMKLRPVDIAGEDQQIHFVALVAGRVVSCVLLQEKEPGIMKIRQMVTDPEFEGLGIGRTVVEQAVAWAKQAGRHKLVAHVRVVAQGFWMKMGFVTEPGSFEEVGLPHVRMVKSIINE